MGTKVENTFYNSMFTQKCTEYYCSMPYILGWEEGGWGGGGVTQCYVG